MFCFLNVCFGWVWFKPDHEELGDGTTARVIIQNNKMHLGWLPVGIDLARMVHCCLGVLVWLTSLTLGRPRADRAASEDQSLDECGLEIPWPFGINPGLMNGDHFPLKSCSVRRLQPRGGWIPPCEINYQERPKTSRLGEMKTGKVSLSLQEISRSQQLERKGEERAGSENIASVLATRAPGCSFREAARNGLN